MKSILKLIPAFILFLAVASASAQIRDTTGNTRPYSTPSNKTMEQREYVTISNGTAMLFSNGSSTALSNAYTCTDGSKVSTDGTVTKSNGKTVKLNEGDKIFKDGHIKSSKKSMPEKNDMNSPDKY